MTADSFPNVLQEARRSDEIWSNQSAASIKDLLSLEGRQSTNQPNYKEWGTKLFPDTTVGPKEAADIIWVMTLLPTKFRASGQRAVKISVLSRVLILIKNPGPSYDISREMDSDSPAVTLRTLNALLTPLAIKAYTLAFKNFANDAAQPLVLPAIFGKSGLHGWISNCTVYAPNVGKSKIDLDGQVWHMNIEPAIAAIFIRIVSHVGAASPGCERSGSITDPTASLFAIMCQQDQTFSRQQKVLAIKELVFRLEPDMKSPKMDWKKAASAAAMMVDVVRASGGRASRAVPPALLSSILASVP